MLCPAPWVGMQIAPEGASPCCSYKKSSLVSADKIHSFNDVMYSKEFEDLRYKMQNNIIDSNCNQCYIEEKNGQKSHRQFLLENYDNSEIAVKQLEIIFDNICNLKCKGCNSGGSHLWAKDEIKIYGELLHDKKLHNLMFDKYDLTKIQNINISGGEPLLSKTAEKFLSLINIKNVHLSLVTNATVQPSQTFLNVFDNCKSLNLTVSLDGYGKLNDFYRVNSNFADIKNNIENFYKYFDKRKNFSFDIITTVNIYNINMLDEIETFLKNYPLINWKLNILEFPMFLSIRYLPQEYKMLLKTIVKQKHLIEILDQPNENYFKHFVNFHNLLKGRDCKLPNSLLQEAIDNYVVTENSQEFFKMQMDIFKNEIRG